MAKKRVVLTFPPELTEKPITYHLVKDFDLAINIFRAQIPPGEEGKLVLELSNGSEGRIKKGLDFLVQQGVGVEAVSKEISLTDEDCIHCGACTAVCQPGALQINPDTDRKSTRLNSSHVKISYAVFCLKKKKIQM